MKKVRSAAVVTLTFFTLVACKKDVKTTMQFDEISQSTLAKIKALGFATSQASKVDEGYLVEGDIVLTDEFLDSSPDYGLLRVADNEQYRTTNLVKFPPKTIKIATFGLSPVYIKGTDLAISRYNALNLQIKFKRITAGRADIHIVHYDEPPLEGYITLAISGFPNRKGDPYPLVKMNTNQYAFGTSPDVNYVGSVIQHELGHCIGFRHTDYMDRSYSCGGTPVNEGADNFGAVHIPGTPTGPDAGSWMLACSNGGNRSFNENDIAALNYLY